MKTLNKYLIVLLSSINISCISEIELKNRDDSYFHELKIDSIVVTNKFFASGEFSRDVPIVTDTIYFFSDSTEFSKLSLGHKILTAKSKSEISEYEFLNDSLIRSSHSNDRRLVEKFPEGNWSIRRYNDQTESFVFGIENDTIVWTSSFRTEDNEKTVVFSVNSYNGDTLFKKIISKNYETEYLIDYLDSSLQIRSIHEEAENRNIHIYHYYNITPNSIRMDDYRILMDADREEEEKIVRKITSVGHIPLIIIDYYFL